MVESRKDREVMAKNAGEVDVVIFAGLRQLAELGYYRVRFVQDKGSTEFYYIAELGTDPQTKESFPIWKRVQWREGSPVLPRREHTHG